MSYSYVNGCYCVTTDIRPNFKRFNKCNAQYRIFTIEDDTVLYGQMRFTYYQFISYNTPIMQLIFDHKYNSWNCSIVDDCFSYSRTTSKQIGQFLNSITDKPISSYDIRCALDESHAITPDISRYCKNKDITIELVSASYLESIWRN